MAIVKFKSVDTQNRTATFDVDGKSVTRSIPKKYQGTIDDYLKALGKGLGIEADLKTVKTINASTLKSGDVIADSSKEAI